MISKSMIKVLCLIINGFNKIEDISKELGLSRNWVSDIITKLEKTRFVNKKRKGNRTYLELSETSFSQEFKNLIKTMPHVKFKNFLYGLNLRILTYCIFTNKSSENIAQQLSLDKKTIWNRLPVLMSRGLLDGETRKSYIVNKRAWLGLYKFLENYRMFSLLPGKVLWKFEDKVVFEVTKKEDISGSLTGLSRYGEFGVPIVLNVSCCYLPKRKLSKEEIFIHSILEIDHARIILMALTFYLKNKLNKKKLAELAMTYDCKDKLEDLYRLLKQEKTEVLSFIKEKEMEEFFEQYDVKWKPN